jgi:ABC-type dipeptide/oligopeptide/nickel transport system permease component
MFRFLVRRTGFIIFVLIFIVYAVYLGMGMSDNSQAGNPDYNLVPFSQQAWQQTRSFFSGVVRGDFGTVPTATGEMPITELMVDAYGKSMGLLLVSLALAAFVGIFLGARAALRRHNVSPSTLLLITLVGISVPSFFAALLLQRGAIRYMQISGTRLVSASGFAWDWDHMLLPVLVLSARPLAYLTRATFLSLSQVMDRDYIRTAYAKGLRRFGILGRHAFRNLAIPVLTAIGVSLRFSLASLPVVEYFFNWPGIGFHTLAGISNQQTEVVVSLAFALGLTFLLVNLMLDISYQLIDPRLRTADDN